MRTPLMIIVLSAFLISACGGASRWYLNGKSEYQFRMDDASCQQYSLDSDQSQGGYYTGYGIASDDSTVAGLGVALAALEYGETNSRYQLCMQSRGYTIAQ